MATAPGVGQLLEAAREIAAALAEHDRLVDAKEVGEMIAMSESAVRRLTREGRIPHVAIPAGDSDAQRRTIRYRRASIRAWVESLEQGGEVVRLRKHQPRLRSTA